MPLVEQIVTVDADLSKSGLWAAGCGGPQSERKKAEEAQAARRGVSGSSESAHLLLIKVATLSGRVT